MPPQRADRGGAHNLPVEATPLVGRTRELAAGCPGPGTSPDCRLLTIVGPGGIGKTRLAVEIAQSEAGRFRDGAWFVDLAPANAAAVLPTVLLKRLDVPGSGAADARQRLLAYLAAKQMLLVLDNFEHLLDGADLVAGDVGRGAGAEDPGDLARPAQPARGVAAARWEAWNCRRPAHRAGLQLRHRCGCSLPQARWPHRQCGADRLDLAAFDATRLFLQCVRRLQPDFAPDAEEAQLIAEICRRLEGMPLAIELAASWIRSLSLRALAAEVASGLQQLETPLRDVPPRHRSMAAVFDQSWRLLSAREQAILRGLSVFRGGATQEAAAEVTGARAGPISAAWSMPHGCAWAETGAMRSTNSCASTVQRAWQKRQRTGQLVLRRITPRRRGGGTAPGLASF